MPRPVSLVNVALVVALYVAAWTHVLLAPYTKVEESFSLQAIHDFFAYGVRPSRLSQYDHVAFPGAVPRSFFGPLLVAVASYGPLLAVKAAKLLQTSADVQLVVRLLLATAYVASIVAFAWLVLDAGSHGTLLLQRTTAQTTRRLFYAISIVQFHPLFWAGRTTPNGVVMPLVNVALGLVLTSRHFSAPVRSDLIGLALLTMAAVVSRMELVGLVLPVALLAVVKRTSSPSHKDGKAVSTPSTLASSLAKVALTGASSAFVALSAVVALDTPMWGRRYELWNPLAKSQQHGGIAWPELEAMLFNVVEGKSEEWGISPWHSYATQHVPKLVSPPVVALAALGAVSTMQRSIQRSLALVVVTHIAVLSQLRHKETRFIAYLAPLLNVSAAHGATQLWQGHLLRSRLVTRSLVLASLSVTAAMTAVALIASAGNYPGGQALAVLHTLRGDKDATVHIDVLPAMTGVSLFQSIHHPQRRSSDNVGFGSPLYPTVLPASPVRWTYDKTENLFGEGAIPNAAALIQSFNFIVSEDRQCHGLADFQLMQDGAHAQPLAFSEFGRVRLRKPAAYIARLRDALSTSLTSMNHGPLKHALLPIDFEWREVVWLCERTEK